MAPLIALFTDFGCGGPYVGQMRSVLHTLVPAVPVVDLVQDAPRFDPRAGAYLLEACTRSLPPGALVVAVVDPGVGSGDRRPVWVEAGGRLYVGPDNGLLHRVAAADDDATRHEILWRPAELSATFHGRDLFAPVAGRLARGEAVESRIVPYDPDELARYPADWPAIVYIDHYGNAMTGLQAGALPADARLRVGKALFESARTFSDRPEGAGFWYVNSQGLVELAANRASAAGLYALEPGMPVEPLAVA